MASHFFKKTKALSSQLRVLSSSYLTRCSISENPNIWSEKELIKWFSSGEWKSGWEIIPDESINKKELANQFFKNSDLWNGAFKFLVRTNLTEINIGRYELQGKDLYVIVDEYLTKDESDTNFEAHRIYTDIQYLVYGKEKIGLADIKDTREFSHYDNLNDIIFLKADQNNYRIASPERFFVFFPNDAHRPCVSIDENIPVRKVVVKIRVN